MPKSNMKRKRNAGVGIDFKRAKHKVGKKLPRAQNETDVNFRSRAVTLPGQSVAEDRAGVAVSARNLSLKVSRRSQTLSARSGSRKRACSVSRRHLCLQRGGSGTGTMASS